MSSFKVIRETSDRLSKLLLQAFKADPEISAFASSDDAISYSNPTETARNPSHQLSLWLYQVTENEFVKNQSRQMIDRNSGNGKARERKPPLALNLYYLVTPFAQSRENDLLLLGKAMLVLYDNAILPLSKPDDDVQEELHLTFCRLSLEELTRIWEALREPYRLSVCYQVRINRIGSDRENGAGLVGEGARDFQEMPEV